MSMPEIKARDLRPGHRIVLRGIGSRRVLSVEDDTIGMTGRPCVRVVYALGQSLAPKGEHVSQPTCGLRPLDPDEPVMVERLLEPAP